MSQLLGHTTVRKLVKIRNDISTGDYLKCSSYSESEDETFDYIAAAGNMQGMEEIHARNEAERVALEHNVALRIREITEKDIRKKIECNWKEIVICGEAQRKNVTKVDRKTAVNQLRATIRRQEREELFLVAAEDYVANLQ